MSEVNVKWSSAEVREAKLAVELDGEVSSEWEQSFKRTIRVLPGGEWGEVTLEKHSINVNEVRPGCEEKLRHYLESAIAQANSTTASEDEEADESEAGDGEQADGQGPDAEMTERFRAFADADRG
jgi:hypothetical protein